MIPESAHDPAAVTLTSHPSLTASGSLRTTRPPRSLRVTLSVVAFLLVLGLDAIVAVSAFVSYETHPPRRAAVLGSDSGAAPSVSADLASSPLGDDPCLHRHGPSCY